MRNRDRLGDRVMAFFHLGTRDPGHKLKNKYYGPFRIVQLSGTAAWLRPVHNPIQDKPYKVPIQHLVHVPDGVPDSCILPSKRILRDEAPREVQINAIRVMESSISVLTMAFQCDNEADPKHKFCGCFLLGGVIHGMFSQRTEAAIYDWPLTTLHDYYVAEVLNVGEVEKRQVRAWAIEAEDGGVDMASLLEHCDEEELKALNKDKVKEIADTFVESCAVFRKGLINSGIAPIKLGMAYPDSPIKPYLKLLKNAFEEIRVKHSGMESVVRSEMLLLGDQEAKRKTFCVRMGSFSTDNTKKLAEGVMKMWFGAECKLVFIQIGMDAIRCDKDLEEA